MLSHYPSLHLLFPELLQSCMCRIPCRQIDFVVFFNIPLSSYVIPFCFLSLPLSRFVLNFALASFQSPKQAHNCHGKSFLYSFCYLEQPSCKSLPHWLIISFLLSYENKSLLPSLSFGSCLPPRHCSFSYFNYFFISYLRPEPQVLYSKAWASVC